MREVTRYGRIGEMVMATDGILRLYPSMMVYVLASDYDAAQSELAELREELASAKRDAKRYRELRKFTPYRFKKMQDASVTDGGDVLYFHADKFDALMDAELIKPTESGASE